MTTYKVISHTLAVTVLVAAVIAGLAGHAGIAVSGVASYLLFLEVARTSEGTEQ